MPIRPHGVLNAVVRAAKEQVQRKSGTDLPQSSSNSTQESIQA
jgi:hypothetical protein